MEALTGSCSIATNTNVSLTDVLKIKKIQLRRVATITKTEGEETLMGVAIFSL